MGTKIAMALGGVGLVAFIVAYPLMVVFGPEPATTELATTQAAPEPVTRIITVGGTGLLQEEGGKFFVRASCQLEVALGAIDDDTRLFDEHRAALGDRSVMRERYLGKRVTVIATVEVTVDEKEVFRAVRTDNLIIFRHSDGLVARQE
ncbi:MAG: hypothetical protein IT406_00065 [Candidatus Yanofskybacteria bacterium]|nr:hypothetical protein [Candidatus Yanofskybacteria bacterium]